MKFYFALTIAFSAAIFTSSFAQENTTIEIDSTNTGVAFKLKAFNKKMEGLFKIIPVPIVSYSTETGSVLGLAKFNVLNIVKGDTVTTASSFSELVSFSSEGQFKVIIGSSVFLMDDAFNFRGNVQYIDFPEYILGIGNEVSRDNIEQIVTQKFAFSNTILSSINKPKTLYAVFYQDYLNYLSVESDSTGFLETTKYPGYNGGVASGLGVGLNFDSRDNKYNPSKGMFIETKFQFFRPFLGSTFNYNLFSFDIRKYHNIWLKHVLAFQFYTEQNTNEVPYYQLAKIGGNDRMRGYYQGAIRDKTLVDAQIEYRMPVWGPFGVVAFASAGRVAPNYGEMSLDGLWYASGVGFRIMVDEKSKVNLRIDFGFGQYGTRAVIFNFSEAF